MSVLKIGCAIAYMALALVVPAAAQQVKPAPCMGRYYPIACDPYLQPPIQGTISKSDAANLLAAADDLEKSIEAAIKFDLDASWYIPLPPEFERRSFHMRIANGEIDKAVSDLTKFQSDIAALQLAINATLIRHPDAKDALVRIIGDTQIDPLAAWITKYLDDLSARKEQKNISNDAQAIREGLFPTVKSFSILMWNFNRWKATFLSERIPEARKQLQPLL